MREQGIPIFRICSDSLSLIQLLQSGSLGPPQVQDAIAEIQRTDGPHSAWQFCKVFRDLVCAPEVLARFARRKVESKWCLELHDPLIRRLLGPFVADGTFNAELNELFTRELSEDGYSGVEVRVTPMRIEIIIRATRTQNVLGERGKRIRELTSLVQKRFGFPKDGVELYVEKVANRGLCATAQAESLRYKLLGGLPSEAENVTPRALARTTTFNNSEVREATHGELQPPPFIGVHQARMQDESDENRTKTYKKDLERREN
ncbi:40S ribosomal protein S3-3 [Acorus calamus]|uniref:40S ribosomal protein S3-3 n=1 Tax=Acorus calamus TaxID=4465 RepID=A0AAV9DYJ6_ACOCL|nr:40S ribosomal protein S3-3 [Acorus calamus]